PPCERRQELSEHASGLAAILVEHQIENMHCRWRAFDCPPCARRGGIRGQCPAFAHRRTHENADDRNRWIRPWRRRGPPLRSAIRRPPPRGSGPEIDPRSPCGGRRREQIVPRPEEPA